MEDREELRTLDVGAKWQSKKELYTILTTTENLYLPQISNVNRKYLRGVWTEEKLHAKCSEVKVVKVPHIKGLKVASILECACSIIDLKKYLPEYEYQKEAHRDWIWSLVNILIQDEFQRFLNSKISIREEDLIKQQSLKVPAVPEIIDILREFEAVSISKGKSLF